jgi:hypothetical protein
MHHYQLVRPNILNFNQFPVELVRLVKNAG